MTDRIGTLDTLEASAKAATKGGVCTYFDADEARWQICGDGVAVTSDDADLIEACTPERVIALVRVARAAQTCVNECAENGSAWLGDLQAALDSLPK